jgi:branched-chain amino acid transport system substrate-binding protein
VIGQFSNRIWEFMSKVFGLFLFVVLLSVRVEAEEVLRVGAILPLSGPLASIGEGSRRGLELAEEMINRDGGVLGSKIKVVYQDSGSEPAKGLSAFNQMIYGEDLLPILYVGLTSVTQAIKARSNENKILVLTDSTFPGILENSRFLLRRSINAHKFMRDMKADLKKRGIRKIVLITPEEEWGVPYSKGFTEDPYLEVLASEELNKDSVDVRSSLLRLKAKVGDQADAILVLLIGSVQSVVLKEIKKSGFKLPVHSFFLCSQPGLTESLGSALNGSITYEARFERVLESYQTYEKLYQERFNFPFPEATSVVAYDFLLSVKHALEVHRSKRISAEQLKAYFIGSENLAGIAGFYEFDDVGDSRIGAEAYVFADGLCVTK